MQWLISPILFYLGVTRYNSVTGMSSLAKQLVGEDITVKQDWKVLSLQKMTGEEGSPEV